MGRLTITLMPKGGYQTGQDTWVFPPDPNPDHAPLDESWQGISGINNETRKLVKKWFTLRD